MTRDATKDPVEPWTRDKTQRDRLLDLVQKTILRESRYLARTYHVYAAVQDIASEVQLELIERMSAHPPSHPCDSDTVQQAAESLIREHRIRELARAVARRMAKQQSKQAQLLDSVEVPVLPEDREHRLVEIARRVSEIAKNTPSLTTRDDLIFRLETCRRVGLDDLSADRFNRAACEAGVAPGDLRVYIDMHDQKGHLSARDRKAWSRAKTKVAARLAELPMRSDLERPRATWDECSRSAGWRPGKAWVLRGAVEANG